jgi:hypothetical protein
VENGTRAELLSTMFLSSLTGPYGGFGFLTRYESIARSKVAQNKPAADASWIKLIDSTTTLYRRPG